MQDLIEFVKAYRAMREQQGRYFKTRYTEDMNKAKKLEKDLDAKAKQILENDTNKKQSSLF